MQGAGSSHLLWRLEVTVAHSTVEKREVIANYKTDGKLAKVKTMFTAALTVTQRILCNVKGVTQLRDLQGHSASYMQLSNMRQVCFLT